MNTDTADLKNHRGVQRPRCHLQRLVVTNTQQEDYNVEGRRNETRQTGGKNALDLSDNPCPLDHMDLRQVKMHLCIRLSRVARAGSGGEAC